MKRSTTAAFDFGSKEAAKHDTCGGLLQEQKTVLTHGCSCAGYLGVEQRSAID